jgi:hypothetical protein
MICLFVCFCCCCEGSDQLSFNKGDKILIHEKRESGWWRGELNGVIGFVPCNYVKEDNILENTPQNLPRTESVENSTLGSHVKTSSGYTSPRTNNVNSNLGEVVVAQYPYTPSGLIFFSLVYSSLLHLFNSFFHVYEVFVFFVLVEFVDFDLFIVLFSFFLRHSFVMKLNFFLSHSLFFFHIQCAPVDCFSF